MAEKKNFSVLDIALVAAPALAVLARLTFAAPCGAHDGMLPACATAGRFVLALGVLALGLGVMRLLNPEKRVRLVSSALELAAGLAIAFLPGNVLPLCMMETMRCHTVMQPTMLIAGIVIAALSLVGLFTARSERA